MILLKELIKKYTFVSEFENSGGLQQEEFSVSNKTGQHLKFKIMSGYDHFVSVHKIHVDGTAVHGS